MDSYEWNKIAGWVLAAAVAILGLSIITGYVFRPDVLEKPAFVVEGVEAEAAGAVAEERKPIAFFLQTASAERGAAQFKKCAACHTINAGGASGIGPNLHGIMGVQHAHIAGFAYSDAMLATKDQIWDWDAMDKWLENPRAYIPGNKMSFAGISKPQDRADLLLYLNSQSNSPKPVPPPPAATETADAMPAGAAGAGTPTAEKPAQGTGKAPDISTQSNAGAEANPASEKATEPQPKSGPVVAKS